MSCVGRTEGKRRRVRPVKPQVEEQNQAGLCKKSFLADRKEMGAV